MRACLLAANQLVLLFSLVIHQAFINSTTGLVFLEFPRDGVVAMSIVAIDGGGEAQVFHNYTLSVSTPPPFSPARGWNATSAAARAGLRELYYVNNTYRSMSLSQLCMSQQRIRGASAGQVLIRPRPPAEWRKVVAKGGRLDCIESLFANYRGDPDNITYKATFAKWETDTEGGVWKSGVAGPGAFFVSSTTGSTLAVPHKEGQFRGSVYATDAEGNEAIMLKWEFRVKRRDTFSTVPSWNGAVEARNPGMFVPAYVIGESYQTDRIRPDRQDLFQNVHNEDTDAITFTMHFQCKSAQPVASGAKNAVEDFAATPANTSDGATLPHVVVGGGSGDGGGSGGQLGCSPGQFFIDSSTGETLANPQQAGAYVGTVRALDGAGESTDVFTWEFNVADPPEFSTTTMGKKVFGKMRETHFRSTYSVNETYSTPDVDTELEGNQTAAALFKNAASNASAITYTLAIRQTPHCQYENCDNSTRGANARGNRPNQSPGKFLVESRTAATLFTPAHPGSYIAQLIASDGGAKPCTVIAWNFTVATKPGPTKFRVSHWDYGIVRSFDKTRASSASVAISNSNETETFTFNVSQAYQFPPINTSSLVTEPADYKNRVTYTIEGAPMVSPTPPHPTHGMHVRKLHRHFVQLARFVGGMLGVRLRHALTSRNVARWPGHSPVHSCHTHRVS